MPQAAVIESVAIPPTRPISTASARYPAHQRRNVARSRNITTQQAEQEFFKTIRPSSIIQRFATTDEVAALVTFIASPLSSATNGAALRVEGGVVRSIL